MPSADMQEFHISQPPTTLYPIHILSSRAALVRQRCMRRALTCAQVWVHEQADGRLDIVDGKQRITSLLSYLDGIFPRNQQTFTLEASSRIRVLQAGTQTHTSITHPLHAFQSIDQVLRSNGYMAVLQAALS